MKNFKITWEIELDAKNHKDAAITALGFMRHATSTAHVFMVTDTKTGETCEVDLWKKEEEHELPTIREFAELFNTVFATRLPLVAIIELTNNREEGV